MDTNTAKRLTSPCGIPCFHCPAYMASSNPEIRKRVAETLNVPEEKAACEGCRAQEGRIRVLNPDVQCKIFSCAAGKGVEFCHECDDFPCGRFQPYADKAQYPHNTKMYQLCMMKKLGFEKWADEEARKIWDTYRTTPFDFKNILY